MDGKAVNQRSCFIVNQYGEAFLSSLLAQTLHIDEHTGCLLFVQARLQAYEDVVEQDINVGHLMRMERCHMRWVLLRDHVTPLYHQLKDEANLEDLRLTLCLINDRSILLRLLQLLWYLQTMADFIDLVAFEQVVLHHKSRWFCLCETTVGNKQVKLVIPFVGIILILAIQMIVKNSKTPSHCTFFFLQDIPATIGFYTNCLIDVQLTKRDWLTYFSSCSLKEEIGEGLIIACFDIKLKW